LIVYEGRKIGDKFGCEKLEDWGRRRKGSGWERAGGITEFAEAASGTLRIRGFLAGVLRISATREEASSFGGL
jgi:hypothetical protein